MCGDDASRVVRFVFMVDAINDTLTAIGGDYFLWSLYRVINGERISMANCQRTNSWSIICLLIISVLQRKCEKSAEIFGQFTAKQ